MGFRRGLKTIRSVERLSGSMGATKALWMSWKDKSDTERLSIISPHPHLPFLWANILIYEEQVIDFHAGQPDRAPSHLLHWYIRSTEPSGMKLRAARTSGSLHPPTPPQPPLPKIVLASLPWGTASRTAPMNSIYQAKRKPQASGGSGFGPSTGRQPTASVAIYHMWQRLPRAWDSTCIDGSWGWHTKTGGGAMGA